MEIVALAEAAAIVAVAGVFSSLIRSLMRSHARREDLLVNQILHATGKPWQPAPVSEPRPDEPLDEDRQIVRQPEQLPVY